MTNIRFIREKVAPTWTSEVDGSVQVSADPVQAPDQPTKPSSGFPSAVNTSEVP